MFRDIYVGIDNKDLCSKFPERNEFLKLRIEVED